MTEQLALPGVPEVPSLWKLLQPEFLFQPKLAARAKVINKRYRPYSRFCSGGMVSIWVSIEEGWVIKVETSDGIGEIEVSEQFYNLVKKKEVVRIEYQVSRLGIREIKVKLLN